MKRIYLLLAIGWLGAAALTAQALSGGRGITLQPPPRTEAGRPFSATAITQTTQTFLDGTHVNQTMTIVEYRDAEGRVRTETQEPRTITIRDPIAGMAYRLDPARKLVEKRAMPGASTGGGRGGGPGGGDDLPQSAGRAAQLDDLGTITVNGVSARGTRVTSVVPVGAIGNDREFRSVTERWFSPELNLIVKSVSTDPRFGNTTYELTNISRRPPDPTLFQVPAGYSESGAGTATKVIEAIEFRGANRVPVDTLRALVQTKVGDFYDDAAQRRDFNTLWNTGRYNDIQVKADAGAHGGIILRFVLTEK